MGVASRDATPKNTGQTQDSGKTAAKAAAAAGVSQATLDEEAYMLLVTSNSQGELSPLEYGLHALKLPKAEGGRGKKGGLSEYAKSIGCDESYIRQLLKAAEVAKETPELTPKFRDKAQHLCAIHKLPKACWRTACDWLAKLQTAPSQPLLEGFGRNRNAVPPKLGDALTP